MKSKTILVLLVVALVLGLMCAVFVSGCGGDEATETTADGQTETTAGGSDTTAAASGTFDGELVVGALGTLTGMGAMNGAEQVWAYDKAVADINAAGGVDVGGKKMELKLKWVDDKSDPTEGAAAVEKLIKVEGTKLILSTPTTPINMSAAIVAKKYQALYQSVITWTSSWPASKWQVDQRSVLLALPR